MTLDLYPCFGYKWLADFVKTTVLRTIYLLWRRLSSIMRTQVPFFAGERMLESTLVSTDIRTWGGIAGGTISSPPLSDAERAAAEHVARRLHAELRGAINVLPDDDRGASAMARALHLDRATCQRIVGTVTRADADAASLINFPGVLGLRQFVEALAKRKDANAEQLAACTAAIDKFEQLLVDLGGSQRRLRERILATDAARLQGREQQAYVGADDPKARDTLFRAAALITGRWSHTSLAMRIIRPTPGNAKLTEEVVVRGFIGHVARPEAVPLVVGFNNQSEPDHSPAFSALDSRPASGSTARSLIDSFCSSPLPKVTSRNAGKMIMQVLDVAEREPTSPLDIVLANRGAKPEAHPASLRPAIGEVWSLVTFPSRQMVFDVYLHRDIARRCIPALEVHLWNPDIHQQGSSRWSTRFPGGPKLELLGQGLSNCGTDAYARHKDLTNHVFTNIGWDGAEFVGYRCHVAFPIWRAGYCMTFDFAGNEM